MRTVLLAGVLAMGFCIAASAQAPAPGSNTGGGGSVGPSVSEPREPTGTTPPGTPTARTPAGAEARDTTGASIIGRTTTQGSGAPGMTDGKEAGGR